ncbi:MAG: hypothetical protein DMF84_12755 [Acidobacteria bacterium]|nr:MAG: hypothetical protein DMF84_12755 [Acidobacteriota bacterium]
MFLAALSGLAGFPGQSSLRAWVIGIARHKVEDVYRRLLRAPHAAVFADVPGLDDASPPRRLITGAIAPVRLTRVAASLLEK